MPSYTSSEFAVARVILYPGAAGTRFNYIPGSHRRHRDVDDPNSHATGTWSWTTVGPRDCLVFDPRLVHCGDPLRGPKAMLIATYGAAVSPATIETYFHARIRTSQLGFDDPLPEFAEHLRARGIMLEAAVNPTLWGTFERIWPADS